MGPEKITISAGGASWSAFIDAEVRAAYNEAARSFKLTVAAEGGPFVTAWVFKAGTPVDIRFNGELVCRGYVDRYQPRLAEHSDAQIVVSGRGKGQDLIDSSADHKTGQFKKKTPVEIMQELDRAGVGVVTNRQLEKIENYRLTPGETVFRCGEKLCRKQQMTLAGQADGRILVTNGLQGMHAGGLIEGVNIKIGEADHNWSGRHSKVIVRGQRAIGHGADAIEIEGVSQDGAIGRNRPLILLQDDDTTKQIAKKRADHRRDREAGSALKATITVQGFRDTGGAIWSPGHGVFVQSPFLDISQVMLIESATFTQSRDGGSLTALGLVDPRAYKGKSGKGGKSGGAWQTDAGKD